jgi:hypothetical protein
VDNKNGHFAKKSVDSVFITCGLLRQWPAPGNPAGIYPQTLPAAKNNKPALSTAITVYSHPLC